MTLMASRADARILDLLLRSHAAHWAVQLAGRARSAEALDVFFHEAVALVRPQTFAEIGAFEAAASRRVKSAHPGCTVVAFEASPQVHAFHSSRTDYAAEGVDYRNYAVADHDGSVELHVGGAVAGNAASLLDRLDTPDASTVTVPSVTLDSAVGEHPGRTVLWIDVEGAVGQVLACAGRALQHVDLAKVEVEDGEHWHGQSLAVDVIETMLDHELYPVLRDVEYAGQYNIVFASDRLLRELAFTKLLEAALHDQATRREPSVLRANDTVRQVARPLRRIVRRLADTRRPDAKR